MAGERDLRHLLEVILDTGKSPEEVCQGDPGVARRGPGSPAIRAPARGQARRPASLVLGPRRRHGATQAVDRPTASSQRLRSARRAGPGRHGCRVPGVGSAPPPPGRHQDAAGRRLCPTRRTGAIRREAEAAAGLRHANIVQVYQVGDFEGRPYFTMEFVEGGSLAEKLAGTPLAGGRAAMLLATVAEAVQAAHDRGIVHRDSEAG